MLDFDDEDDEGEFRREFQGMEELERVEEEEDEVRPGGRGRPGVASSTMRPVSRRGGAKKKTIEVSSLSPSCHALT